MELIRQTRQHLIDVGGHPMAAGFSFVPANLDVVTTELQRIAKLEILVEQLVPSLPVECLLPTSLATVGLVEKLAEFEPFGQANPEPIFGFTDLKILDIMTMGQDQRHSKLVLASQDGYTPLYALGWSQGHRAAELKIGASVDLAGVLEINEWKNKRSLQIKIKDLKLSLV